LLSATTQAMAATATIAKTANALPTHAHALVMPVSVMGAARIARNAAPKPRFLQPKPLLVQLLPAQKKLETAAANAEPAAASQNHLVAMIKQLSDCN
jgi:hypothetical protein